MSLLFQSLLLKSLTVMLFGFFLRASYRQLFMSGGCVYQSDRTVCGKYRLARLFLPSQM